MSEDKIELHTVGIFRGKEYEMQEVFNGLLEENQRLNNIIEKTESVLKRLIEEQEYCYKKYPENWKERTSVSNTWLTSRDCYWSVLNYLKKLKGSGKE